MTRVVKDIVVSAPIERVFAALVEPAQRARWVASMREGGEGGALTLGSRVEGRRTAPGSRSVYHLTVRRLEPPRVLEMDIMRNGDAAGGAGFELTADGAATRVRAYAEAHLKGFQKLAAPMVASGIEEELKVDLASLKKFVEAG